MVFGCVSLYTAITQLNPRIYVVKRFDGDKTVRFSAVFSVGEQE